MKTFLIDVKKGKYVGTFADAAAAEAAAGGKAGLVSVSTAKQLAELSAKDLSAVTAICGTKTKVTDADKAKAAADVFAALKALGNTPVGSTKDRAKNEDSKMEKAYALFVKMYGKKPRSEIIAAFRDEVQLTEGGAPTYFYLCVKRMTAEYKADGKQVPEGVASVRTTKPKAEKKSAAKKPVAKANGAKKPAVKKAAVKKAAGKKAAGKKAAPKKVAPALVEDKQSAAQ